MKNLWIIPGMALFTIMISLPLPPELRLRDINLTTTMIVLSAALIIYFSLKGQHWLWKSLTLAITLWLFSVPMLRIWENAASTWNIVLGILPWSDASGYYEDANRLLWGGEFGAFSGRRPIFSGFLAVLLKLTSQNLQLALLALTVLNGFAAFLTIIYIRDILGRLAATFTGMMIFFFYQEYSGTVLTEQLGLPLGLLAVSLQIRAVSHNSKWQYAFGLSILTFALLTRAGPFFVFPFLFLFGVRQYIRKKQEIISTIVLLISALLIPVAVNMALQRGITASSAAPMGNFSYTLYGQAVGGKGWGQVMEDYPELKDLPEKERTSLVYSLAFQKIRANPLKLIQGSLNAWRDFFIPNGISFFSRQYTPDSILNRIINILLTLLLAGGIYRLWQNRKEALPQFFLYYLIGITLSVPFIPPIDANVRPYITIIAILILIVSQTIVTLLENKLSWQLKPASKWLKNDNKIIQQTCLIIFFFASAGPFIVKFTAQPPPTATISCQPGETPVIFELNPGSFVILRYNEELQNTQFPQIPHKHVARSMADFYYGDFASIIRNIHEPGVVTYTINLFTNKGVWIIAPPATKNDSSQLFFACGLRADISYPVVYITSIQQQLNP